MIRRNDTTVEFCIVWWTFNVAAEPALEPVALNISGSRVSCKTSKVSLDTFCRFRTATRVKLFAVDVSHVLDRYEVLRMDKNDWGMRNLCCLFVAKLEDPNVVPLCVLTTVNG